MEEKKYGDWTFLREAKNKHGKIDYECRCKCGIVKIVDKRNLIMGRSKRCRQCDFYDRSKISTMIGNKFGKYLVISQAESNHRDTYYHCRCDCGNEKIIRGTDLRKGRSHRCHSCGTKESILHGKSRTPSYASWKSIRQRCYNKNMAGYMYYGGRGIKVCDRWLESFENFYEDMGDKPKGMQLDRIDPDGNYEKDNCRWVSPLENASNRRCSAKYRGQYVTIKRSSLCSNCLPDY